MASAFGQMLKKKLPLALSQETGDEAAASLLFSNVTG
jgi:hypothetical protein